MELLAQAAIGLLAGLLGGLLGIGGSIVIIPALIIYLSYTRSGYTGNVQHLLQAAAMVCNVFIAAPAALAHYRAGAIVKPVVVYLIPAALVGIILGVAASNSPAFSRANGAHLAMILAGFLLYVAAYNSVRLFRKTDLTRRFEEHRKPAAWAVVAVGTAMGFAAGLLGIGGGALCVPGQQILLKIPLRRAIANSAATIVSVSAVGACYKNLTLPDHGFRAADSLRLAVMLIPTAMVGSYLGGRLTHALPRNVLRVAFIAFMTAVAYLTFSKARDASMAASKATPSARAADGSSWTVPSRRWIRVQAGRAPEPVSFASAASHTRPFRRLPCTYGGPR
jgi:uncharacterized membrane protein YfcA